MNMLVGFMLVGMVDSADNYFATVELSTVPASKQDASLAVMPNNAFPCEVYEGRIFYVVKMPDTEDAVIVCQKDVEEEPTRQKQID